MKKKLLHLPITQTDAKNEVQFFAGNCLRKSLWHPVVLLLVLLNLFSVQINAQTSQWTPLFRQSPNANAGVMLLLSDGTVMAKTSSGGSDGVGTQWDRLTPDIFGNYTNGTWSTAIAPMHNSRLYFSSQVLKDGRVYVAGGEYGTGGSLGEVYNPLTNVWTSIPATGERLSDANSEILSDGRVLQAIVSGTLRGNNIYNPLTNSYSVGPSCLGIHNESAWLKLPDKSVLFVDRLSRNSERYIQKTNTWISDATVPVDLYDPFGLEIGGAVLLPNGKAFFIGSTGHTAIYTPSGTTTNGSWVAGPDIPNNQGAPDAAAAMMVNGNVLCAVSPVPTSSNHFPSPISFYVYNYKKNTFKQVLGPNDALTTPGPAFITNMLDLPNGQVLFCLQGSTQYYVYTPGTLPLASGKPTITGVVSNGSSYILSGTLFNGISEGATYGDDWQMNTNYPIVRLTKNAKVYYARTFNWNRTAIMTGTLPCTTEFTVPPGLLQGKYSLVVVANGIASDPITFKYVPSAAPAITEASDLIVSNSNEMKIYPNPAREQTTIQFTLAKATHVSLMLSDLNGKDIKTLLDNNLDKGDHNVQVSTDQFSKGVYIVRMITTNGIKNVKLVVQ